MGKHSTFPKMRNLYSVAWSIELAHPLPSGDKIVTGVEEVTANTEEAANSFAKNIVSFRFMTEQYRELTFEATRQYRDFERVYVSPAGTLKPIPGDKKRRYITSDGTVTSMRQVRRQRGKGNR